MPFTTLEWLICKIYKLRDQIMPYTSKVMKMIVSKNSWLFVKSSIPRINVSFLAIKRELHLQTLQILEFSSKTSMMSKRLRKTRINLIREHKLNPGSTTVKSLVQLVVWPSHNVTRTSCSLFAFLQICAF